MTLETGKTVDGRGEAHQSSLRSSFATKGLDNLHRSVLGIVLKTYTSDDHQNSLTHQHADRHSFGAVCDVLVTNDGKGDTYWNIPNVRILPTHPSGLDNFEESLPRGSSKYVNGEDYDATLSEADVYDLDGDWVIVSFMGGNINVPYISNYWTSPRNTYDPQTNGKGHPDSSGAGQALKQFNSKGRYFRRVNGVEHVVNERGDIFLSTHYAGGELTPNSEGSTTNGRFSREVKPLGGGGIRLNVKTSQPLELDWNEQEDGIGVNSAHDPALPQTNPQPTTPYSRGSRTSTFIRVTDQVASFEVPGLFYVKSQKNFKLESFADSDIIVGDKLGITVGGTHEVTVGNDYTLTTTLGNLNFVSVEGDILVTSEAENVKFTAAKNFEVAADVAAVLNAPKVTLGAAAATNTQPAIQGTLFAANQAALWGAMTTLAAAIAADSALLPTTKTAATAVVNAITPYLATDLATQLSGTVFVGP